ATAERKDLRPPDLDDTTCGANSAAFVTEHDDRVAVGDEFVGLEDFELQRRGQRRQILLATLTPPPRAAPTRYDRRACGDRWDEFGVVGCQVNQRREISRNECLVDLLDSLEMPMVAHPSPSYWRVVILGERIRCVNQSLRRKRSPERRLKRTWRAA